MTLPEGLTSIGVRAFAQSKLSSLTLPEGLSCIGSQAFADCPLLNKINLPTSLTCLAPDAFSNCPNLRLTPTVLEQLARFPEARRNIVPLWEKSVLAYVEAGDKLLLHEKVTMADKKAAYEQYRRALSLDPFHMPAIYMLGQLLLSYQVPNGNIVSDLKDLQNFLSEQASLEALEFLNSTLSMLDNVCVILSDPEDIITQRQVYGLNCDQSAATSLLEFLLDALEKHPKISDFARHEIFSVAKWIIIIPTRNKDRQSEKQFSMQKKRYNKIFGTAPDDIGISNPISMLTSESMMCHFRKAMAKEKDEGFYDAEFWLGLARIFNPNIQIPKEFTQMQSRHRAKEETEKWQERMATVVFPPNPILPMPHYNYCEENSFKMNDLVSEYWADVAAQKEADAIESLWGDLSDGGFWDDTSWQ